MCSSEIEQALIEEIVDNPTVCDRYLMELYRVSKEDVRKVRTKYRGVITRRLDRIFLPSEPESLRKYKRKQKAKV